MTVIPRNRPLHKLNKAQQECVYRKQDGLGRRREKEAEMTKLELAQQHRRGRTKNKLMKKEKAGIVEPPPMSEKLAYIAAKDELVAIQPLRTDLVACLQLLPLDHTARKEEEKRLKREDKAHLTWMHNVITRYDDRSVHQAHDNKFYSPEMDSNEYITEWRAAVQHRRSLGIISPGGYGQLAVVEAVQTRLTRRLELYDNALRDRDDGTASRADDRGEGLGRGQEAQDQNDGNANGAENRGRGPDHGRDNSDGIANRGDNQGGVQEPRIHPPNASRPRNTNRRVVEDSEDDEQLVETAVIQKTSKRRGPRAPKSNPAQDSVLRTRSTRAARALAARRDQLRLDEYHVLER